MTEAFHAETLIALLGVAGSVLAAIGAVAATIFAYYGRKEAAGANKAVNNRKPNEKPLYEMVKDTYVLGIANSLSLKKFELWYDGYDGGPLDTGPKAQAFVDSSEKSFDDLRVHLDQIEQRVEEIRSEVLADVMKYGCPVAKREAESCQNPDYRHNS
jgi:hypothetical protein